MYEQYYPLVTEEDKNKIFLDGNGTEIYKIVRNILCTFSMEYSEIQHGYLSKMKSNVSFLGTPKYKNIVHNKEIINKMSRDKTLALIERKIPNLEELSCKLVFGEFEKNRYWRIKLYFSICKLYETSEYIQYLYAYISNQSILWMVIIEVKR